MHKKNKHARVAHLRNNLLHTAAAALADDDVDGAC